MCHLPRVSTEFLVHVIHVPSFPNFWYVSIAAFTLLHQRCFHPSNVIFLSRRILRIRKGGSSFTAISVPILARPSFLAFTRFLFRVGFEILTEVIVEPSTRLHRERTTITKAVTFVLMLVTLLV